MRMIRINPFCSVNPTHIIAIYMRSEGATYMSVGEDDKLKGFGDNQKAIVHLFPNSHIESEYTLDELEEEIERVDFV